MHSEKLVYLEHRNIMKNACSKWTKHFRRCRVPLAVLVVEAAVASATGESGALLTLNVHDSYYHVQKINGAGFLQMNFTDVLYRSFSQFCVESCEKRGNIPCCIFFRIWTISVTREKNPRRDECRII